MLCPSCTCPPLARGSACHPAPSSLSAAPSSRLALPGPRACAAASITKLCTLPALAQPQSGGTHSIPQAPEEALFTSSTHTFAQPQPNTHIHTYIAPARSHTMLRTPHSCTHPQPRARTCSVMMPLLTASSSCLPASLWGFQVFHVSFFQEASSASSSRNARC